LGHAIATREEKRGGKLLEGQNLKKQSETGRGLPMKRAVRGCAKWGRWRRVKTGGKKKKRGGRGGR